MAWARRSTTRSSDPSTSIGRAASTRRSARTKRCSRTWCAACWKTVPTRRSCIGSSTVRSRSTSCCRIRWTRLPRTAARRISAGIDLNDDPTLAALDRSFKQIAAGDWSAAPILAVQSTAGSSARAVANPARREQVIGHVREATAQDVETALAAARAHAPDWATVPAPQRARMLEEAADALEAHRDTLLWLLTHEAGKTLANAHGEVREAADFLRYYAARICSTGFDERGTPLGVVVAISPWNFPLAIFIGQIAGALAAGNAVIAKPAEQTPLVAAVAVGCLH